MAITQAPADPSLGPDWADGVIDRVLGSTASFLADAWRQRSHLSSDAAAGRLPAYGVEEYLVDLAATHESPYLSVSARSGARFFGRHASIEELREAINAGGVSAMKISRYWHGRCPPSWVWMRELFGSLARKVSMLYLSPQRSEDVDLFLAGPSSGLGRHFDSTDVFTVQLFGERRWVFDRTPDAGRVLALTAEPDWFPAKEVPFQGETVDVKLRPGDALYLPAYCVHEVSGVTWSAALSLGLRAYNEIDVVEHLLDVIRRTEFHAYGPLYAEPESSGEAGIHARTEAAGRVRALLDKIQAATMATLISPLNLPPDLAGSDARALAAAEVSGAYRSGFALLPESPGASQVSRC